MKRGRGRVKESAEIRMDRVGNEETRRDGGWERMSWRGRDE